MIKNKAVGMNDAFLAAYKNALASRNLTVKLLPDNTAVTACPLTTTYTARWRWDLALYLAYANLKVYRNGCLQGEALYDALQGNLDTTRLGSRSAFAGHDTCQGQRTTDDPIRPRIPPNGRHRTKRCGVTGRTVRLPLQSKEAGIVTGGHRKTATALRSIILALGLLAAGGAPALASDDPTHVVGGTEVQRGAYLVAIGGCNDCHTPGWTEHPGQIPPALRLTGSTIGWHGPWGTSFATNLRLLAAGMTQQQWLHLLATFHALPPMPEYNVKIMSTADQVALFAYIKSLGPAGRRAPAALPPGPPPAPPYFSLILPPPAK